MLVLVGIHSSDTLSEVEGWVPKLLKLRIFADEEKPINRSVQDIDGEVLLVSQFTLYGDARGQNRPSFMQAAKPDQASPLYEAMVSRMKECWPKTASGEFGADMQVELVNDGPVTLILE